jgi:glycosyltransferase involved in cell wall biosynthesis
LYLLFIVFLIAVGIQLIYFFAFIVAFSKKIEKREPQHPAVSVIICAHDEENNLRDLIPELLAQDYPEFEVIIVDDRSNDSTFDFLLAETAKDHRLRMVHVNRTPPHANNKKYALTLGIKASRYEWILLTDADCRPDGPKWISTMSSHTSDQTDFVLGYSPYLKRPGLLNAFIRFEALLTGIQYISFALLGNPYMGVGRNMAYRRSRFLEAKGFNNILHVQGGDDDLYVNQFAWKRNTSVCLGPESMTHSIPEATWRNFFLQKVRHLSVGRRYKLKHRLLLGLFMVSWLVTWYAGALFLFLLVHPLIVAGVLGLRVLVVVSTVQIASKKLGEEFERWITPLLDFIYAFYYLVIGLRTLVTKKVRWKN